MRVDKITLTLGITGLLLAMAGAVFILRFLRLSLQMQDYLEAGGVGGGSQFDQITIWSSPFLVLVGAVLILSAFIRAAGAKGRLLADPTTIHGRTSRDTSVPAPRYDEGLSQVRCP